MASYKLWEHYYLGKYVEQEQELVDKFEHTQNYKDYSGKVVVLVDLLLIVELVLGFDFVVRILNLVRMLLGLGIIPVPGCGIRGGTVPCRFSLIFGGFWDRSLACLPLLRIGMGSIVIEVCLGTDSTKFH